MSIVAISDTLGSLGTEIGRRVAEARGYEFADREIITKAAERYHETVTELTHVTEERPTLWERLTDTQRRYMFYVEAILLEMAARDRVVLVGRASPVILRGVSHVVRVRVNAPEDVRAERIQQGQGLTPEAALDYVQETDRERGARVRFLYDVDWDDPRLYDLVLNTARVDAGLGARLIMDVLDAERFQPTEAGQRRLTDLSLAAQAKAALLANPPTHLLHVFVSCTDAHVTLSGGVREEAVRTAAEQTVAGIPGVRGVLNEILVAPPALSLPGRL